MDVSGRGLPRCRRRALLTENKMVKGRKIRFASNIQEQWYRKFVKEHGEAQRRKINMRLCMSGPCVEKYLRDNEVEVEEDWICKTE